MNKASEKVKNYILENLKNLPPAVKQTVTVPNPIYVYEANGCEACNFKGYSGRSGLFEVLSMT